MIAQLATAPVTPDAFKDLFRMHPAGVGVITADPGTGPVAMTVTSLASVSADPALIVFSASSLSSSTPSILGSEHIIAHLIDTDSIAVAQLCATSGADRFSGQQPWAQLPTGEPYFTGVSRWMRCEIIDRFEADLSTIVIARVIDVSLSAQSQHGSPLVYQNRSWHELSDDSLVA